MFNVATKSLPLSNQDTHALCVRATVGGRPVMLRLYSFKSYDLALAAFFAVADEDRGRFAVRSMDDPTLLALGNDPEQYVAWRVVANAVAAALRIEERKTVKWALHRAMLGTGHDGFYNVAAEALASMRQRGFDTERWRIEQTLKDMVTIGRCHDHGNGRAGYYFPRSTGARLMYTRCPECGSRLAQTSLALDSHFHLIADPVTTYSETTLMPLPGEKPEHVEARINRVNAEREPGPYVVVDAATGKYGNGTTYDRAVALADEVALNNVLGSKIVNEDTGRVEHYVHYFAAAERREQAAKARRSA